MVQFRRRTKKITVILPFDNFFLKKLKLVQGQVKKIKVKSGVLKFWALAPGDRDYRFSALKLRRNVLTWLTWLGSSSLL